MPRNSHTKLVKKVVSITEVQNLVMLPRLMEKWGLISESEVFRQALTFYYRKMEPIYTQPTPLQEAKLEKIVEVKKFKEMTDEEYALQTMHALILPDQKGQKWVVMHWFGNTISAKPLEGCKDWFSTRFDIVENHLTICKTLPIEEEIKKPSRVQLLSSMYDIIVSDETKPDQ